MAQGLDRRIRRFALLGVVLHTLFVAAAPFEHHDLICHLKTPQHCTSCTSSPGRVERRNAFDARRCRPQ